MGISTITKSFLGGGGSDCREWCIWFGVYITLLCSPETKEEKPLLRVVVSHAVYVRFCAVVQAVNRMEKQKYFKKINKNGVSC